jgi:hypothetical protein
MTAAAAGSTALAAAPARNPLRERVRDWRRRYLLAEILGTLAALTAGTAAYARTGSLATAALAASFGETAGFYLGIAVRIAPGVLRRHQEVRGARRVLLTLRAAVAEASDYAVAEAMDTLLIRPGLIFVASSWTGAGLVASMLAGKLLADVAFYSVVIPTYELRRRLTGVDR